MLIIFTLNQLIENDVLITKCISFDAAKQEEIENWYKNNVFEEVDDAGQKCVSTRWYTMVLYPKHDS